MKLAQDPHKVTQISGNSTAFLNHLYGVSMVPLNFKNDLDFRTVVNESFRMS